jgi:hypothetical protein
MEAEILEALRRPMEKEMVQGLHTHTESLPDDETEYVRKFQERRQAPTDKQSSSPAPRMP